MCLMLNLLWQIMDICVQVQVMNDVLRSLYAQPAVKTELKDSPLWLGLYQDLAQKALMIQVWRAQVGKPVLHPHAMISRALSTYMHSS